MGFAQDSQKNNKDSIAPKIDLMVINGDTLFTINRKFAEQIAIEHDSLEIVINKLKDTNEALFSCIDIKNQYKKALETSEGISDMLRKESDKKDKIINKYVTIDDLQRTMIKDLQIEFKKAKNRNKWLTGLSIGGVSVGFTSIILLLIK